MSRDASKIQKLELLMQEVVANAIKDEIDLDLEVFLTVSRVAISHTGEHATVWISVIPKDKQKKAIVQLERDIHKIQSYVNGRLKSRKVPKIMLKLDTAEEFAEKLEKLMAEIGPTPPEEESQVEQKAD